jgi:hypothetical protein
MSMSLEQFAKMHGLPARWLSLRRCCETLVRYPQFWSRRDQQDTARKLATEASNILREQRRDCANRSLLCDKPKNTRIA